MWDFIHPHPPFRVMTEFSQLDETAGGFGKQWWLQPGWWGFSNPARVNELFCCETAFKIQSTEPMTGPEGRYHRLSQGFTTDIVKHTFKTDSVLLYVSICIRLKYVKLVLATDSVNKLWNYIFCMSTPLSLGSNLNSFSRHSVENKSWYHNLKLDETAQSINNMLTDRKK